MSAVEHLSLRDCDQLLVELQDPSNEHLLRESHAGETETGVYPHYHVLNNFITERDLEKKAVWMRCIEFLVAKQAPTDRSDMRAASVFASGNWRIAPEMMRQAAQLYFDNGYLQLNSKLPGRLRKPTEHIYVMDGQSPLAAAINFDHDEAVTFFLEHGASLDIGAVVLGGPRLTATEYATERGAMRCLAALTAHAMRQAVAIAPVQAAASEASTQRRARTDL